MNNVNVNIHHRDLNENVKEGGVESDNDRDKRATQPNYMTNGNEPETSSPTITIALALSEEQLQELSVSRNMSICEQYYQLFATKEMFNVTVPLTIVWSMLGVSYYGISLLIMTRLYTSTNDANVCAFDFPPIIENSASELMGIIVITIMINKVGRVFCQVGPYICTAVAIVYLGLVQPTGLTLVITAFLLRGCIMGGFSATWVTTPGL